MYFYIFNCERCVRRLPATGHIAPLNLPDIYDPFPGQSVGLFCFYKPHLPNFITPIFQNSCTLIPPSSFYYGLIIGRATTVLFIYNYLLYEEENKCLKKMTMYAIISVESGVEPNARIRNSKE